MRLLYVTNIVSHLQLPVARCLAASLGEGNFRFAAVEPPIAERVKLGWDMQDSEPWILRAGENEADRSEFEQWWDEADVVLSGERRVARFADRLRGGKLSFYMSERWWKAPPGIDRDGPVEILWAGGMLSWKRVATVVRAFAGLLRQAPQARLTLIGDGPCREQLKRLTEKLGITSNVDFHYSMPVLQVRQQIRQAHVYVLPSSAYEGWGVVLNEAMSEGCAVVASEGAGSAKTMLRHGENGLLFKSGDHQQLAGWLIQLNADEPLRRRLAGAGQRTISEAWSPSLAAERFLAVSDALLSKRQVPDYREGPMRRSGG